jgi:hypothetical protein
LNGKKGTVLTKLNKLIAADFADYGMIEKPNASVDEEYYISENWVKGEKIILKHLFLQLSK